MTDALNALRRLAYVLSRQQVALDLKKLERRWVRDQLADFDVRRAREIAKIDGLERTYWEAWEASLRPQEPTAEVRSDVGVVTRTTVRRRDGNLGALQGVERCIAARVKLFGLEAREVVQAMVDREAQRLTKEYGMPLDEVIRQAEGILRGEGE